MRTDLIQESASVNLSVPLTGSNLLVAQQALSELGWEDMRPAMLAAEQVDHELTMELQSAQAAYVEELEEPQRQRLQIALQKMIEQLELDYQHTTALKEAAQQRLTEAAQSSSSSTSYLGQLGGWMISSLQQFFGSDDASLVERYGEIAEKRQQAIADLTRYQRSLGFLEPKLEEPSIFSKDELIEEVVKLDTQETTTTPMVSEESALPATELFTVVPRTKLSHARRLLTIDSAEFRVNTYTTNDQRFLRVGTFSNGGFVIVWTGSGGQDGSFDGVYAQRYSSSGAPVGSEFGVNTYTTGYQLQPDINVFSDDSFVIAWRSEGQDGSDFGTYARRYSANGVALDSSEFRVNTYTTGYQGGPSIGTFGGGGFVIAWQSDGQDGSNYGVYARRYSSSGVALDSSEFRVNTYTIGSQLGPRIGAFSGGGFVITWESDGQDGSNSGVYAQRYSSGGVPVSGEFRVNTYTTNEQAGANIGVCSDGSFVITWQSSGQDGSGYGVYAQRYSSGGAALGSEFKVNTYVSGSQQRPDIGVFSDNGFVITWLSSGQDGSGYGVYAQRYNASGVALGSEFRVNTYTTGDQGSFYEAPRIDTFIDGGFLIAWESNGQDGSGYGVYARLFSGANKVPVLGQNQLTLNDGATVLITTSGLSATDDFTSAAALTFTVNNVQHGRFELVSSPGVSITQFTQGQVQSSQVRFVHDGSNIAPSYTVSVSDGDLTTSLQSATITFNFRPIINNNGLILKDGETLLVTTSMLSGTDNGSLLGSLVFNVSNVQRGRFEFGSNPGVAITQFTQAQIQASQVRFVHDGSNTAPSYQISVSDGVLNSTSVAGNITFNQRPVLINNGITLKDGETLVVTNSMISSTDNGSLLGSLMFNVSNVQQGRFELNSSPGVAITQFTQAQIQASQVRFVHDGGNTAPSYQISVSDGVLNSTSVVGNITFDQRPTLVNNAISLKDAESLIITPAMMSATDDKATANELLFLVSGVQQGQFELVGSSGVAITQFTQAQIQASQVRFVHDGNNAAPSYQISVSDGVLNSTPVAGNITFDRRPTLVNNAISLKDAESLIITPAMLSATDNKATASELLFLVSGVQRGRFELISSPGTTLTQFTFAQIQASQVRFVHDGGNVAPGYQVSVSDGSLVSTPVAGNIFFDQRPILTKNILSLKDGETLVITSAMLNATDDKTVASALSFTVSAVQNGRFELSNTPGVAVTQFTQAQVQAGEVRFVHEGNNLAPSYQMSVSDGSVSSGATAAVITFNRRPAITTNQLVINEGETVILNSGMLAINDDQTNSSALTFEVFNLQGGHFALTITPTTPITQFTLAQIQAGQVVFVQNVVSTAPNYLLTVSDGAFTSSLSAPSASPLVIFNPRPVLIYNSLNLKGQGLTITLTASQLQVSDNQPDAQLTLTTSSVQNGHFELTTNPGVVVTQFTQADVKASRVQFIRINLVDLPSYAISVSDGALSTTPAVVMVTSNARPTLNVNALSLRNGESVIITTTQLHAVDDNPDSELKFTISNVQNGRFELTTAGGVAITQFTQQQLTAGQVRFVHDGSNQAPGYMVSVSDGELATAPEAAVITFNQSPVLATNTLAVNDGESVVLTSAMLNTTDNQAPTALTYTVSSVLHGRFEFVNAPNVAITQFTQQQVLDGRVRFVHDGGGQTPGYAVSVSDGVMSTPAASVDIQFNLRPVLKVNQLRMKEGDTLIGVTTAMLQAMDDHTPAADLVFSVSNLQGGYFVKTTALSTPITQFTQADVDSGGIAFTRTSTTLLPGYAVSISDGSLSTAPVAATVLVNRVPVLSNNQLSLSQGETVTLTTAMLGVNDDASLDTLTFTVSNVQSGRFELTTAVGVTITQFTAQQVVDGQVRFVHNGSPSAPGYTISVTDGVFTTTTQSAAVTFNQRPVLKNNRLTVNQGETIIFTPSMLSAEDNDNPAGQIRFTVSDVTGGEFTLTDAPTVRVTTFTQQQINDGVVQFIQDGSDQAPGYRISVSDGQATVSPTPAIVQYKPSQKQSPKEQEDFLQTVIKVASSVGTSVGGIVFAIIVYFYYKKHHENATRRHNPMAYDLYKSLNLHLGYISPTIDTIQRRDYLDAVGALAQGLEQKSGIALETLRESDREQYQHYIELLSEYIVRDIKTWRSEICGIGLRGCLETRELRLDQLKKTTKQAQIVDDVIAAVRSGHRPVRARGCCSSLFFCREQPSQRLPSVVHQDRKSDGLPGKSVVLTPEVRTVELTPLSIQSPVKREEKYREHKYERENKYQEDEKINLKIGGGGDIEVEEGDLAVSVGEAAVHGARRSMISVEHSPKKDSRLLATPSLQPESRTPTPPSREIRL
jgi:hypothetical protein